MSGKTPNHSSIAAGQRVAHEMAADIDALKRRLTEEALKHAQELAGNHPHRRRTDKRRVSCSDLEPVGYLVDEN